MILRRPTRRRRGMTIVESALVLSVFSLILFGIFEYCRVLLVMHVTENAAREGARYAVVNLDKPSTFDTVAYTDALGTSYPSIQSYTTTRMAGVDKQLVGYQVAVFPVDTVGLYQTPVVVRPKSKNPPTYPDPFNGSDPNRVAWNQASFTEPIAVTIKGNYTPILPGFMLMPSSIPISITVMAGSEG